VPTTSPTPSPTAPTPDADDDEDDHGHDHDDSSESDDDDDFWGWIWVVLLFLFSIFLALILAWFWRRFWVPDVMFSQPIFSPGPEPIALGRSITVSSPSAIERMLMYKILEATLSKKKNA
jgi:hypothetical protein